jgi:hypothetical protein
MAARAKAAAGLASVTAGRSMPKVYELSKKLKCSIGHVVTVFILRLISSELLIVVQT